MNYLVSTFYTFDGSFGQDDAATTAVGREPDETGCGCGERDLGWICATKDEAALVVATSLESIGMTADVARL